MQNLINCMVIKMKIKQFADGNYYLCRTTFGLKKTSGNKNAKKSYRNWFLIKHSSRYVGILDAGVIRIPQELVGKRIRLRVEVIDD